MPSDYAAAPVWPAVRPLIAIAPRAEERSDGPHGVAVFAQKSLVDGIKAAGGIPVILGGPDGPGSLARLVDVFDGFIVPGGSDVDPARYGAERLAACGTTSDMRDDFELALIPRVVAAGKPLLGICRGLQAINVALGGTLWQDLPTQPEACPRALPHPLTHRQPEPYSETVHTVEVRAESLLESIVGVQTALPVNSIHHQAVRDLAPGLVASAWAPDGVVEAAELPGLRFGLAVQWHPELLWETDQPSLDIFRAFVHESALVASGK
jgi:putative glutamine amidotransferase